MILVDTSVWIDHLRKTNTTLVQLLNKGQVLMHPFIIGELACGNLHKEWKFNNFIILTRPFSPA